MRMIRTGTLNLKEHDSSKFIVKQKMQSCMEKLNSAPPPLSPQSMPSSKAALAKISTMLKLRLLRQMGYQMLLWLATRVQVAAQRCLKPGWHSKHIKHTLMISIKQAAENKKHAKDVSGAVRMRQWGSQFPRLASSADQADCSGKNYEHHTSVTMLAATGMGQSDSEANKELPHVSSVTLLAETGKGQGHEHKQDGP